MNKGAGIVRFTKDLNLLFEQHVFYSRMFISCDNSVFSSQFYLIYHFIARILLLSFRNLKKLFLVIKDIEECV